MRTAIAFFIGIFFAMDSIGQGVQNGGEGCKFDSHTPELLAPGKVSLSERHEFGVALNRDCSELFVGVQHGKWVSIEHYERTSNGWRHISRLLGSENASTNDPALSLDDKKLYFTLRRDGQTDIAFIERMKSSSWSEPKVLPAPVNTPSNEYYTSFNRNGDLVFASNRNSKHPGNYNLYRAMSGKSEFVDVKAFPKGINQRGYEADPFIAPDNDYLLFASSRSGGRGKGDIYVSFHLGKDAWSPPKAIEAINTISNELCPFVSADGSTLYFTSKQDIYRVNASIIESLRPAPE
jgi:Tol biopolymer transport system component